MAIDVVVIGGGAAGIFAAIHAAKTARVILLEKTNQLLAKVRISGGGRCNVTHSCFEPKELVKNYPRGFKELLGPFTRFQPKDTIEWFEERGVALKTEKDGRIFPVSNSSHTIIEALLKAAQENQVDIRLQSHIHHIEKKEELFFIHLENEVMPCKRLIVATGSSPFGYKIASHFGHTIVPTVPSLFTFNVPTSPLKELSGIAVPHVTLKIKNTPLTQSGPLLITHFGFSGPAVLKLSAYGARILHDLNYAADLLINWIPETDHLPRNLSKALKQNEHCLTEDLYRIEGKTTHKEEFVTAGGVNLKELNFKNLESKCCSNLHFAGEILDIDGITGGFNFQNAWTTGFLAGSAAL